MGYSELETIRIFQALEKEGYKVTQDGERWNIAEPNDRDNPQYQRALKTLRECKAWAEGIESARIAVCN